MFRIEAFENAVPREWRGVVRDHPALSIAAALAAGFYFGRRGHHFGRRLAAAFVSAAVAAGVRKLRETAGLPAA